MLSGFRRGALLERPLADGQMLVACGSRDLCNCPFAVLSSFGSQVVAKDIVESMTIWGKK